MAASSTTGRGNGSATGKTTQELTNLSIFFSGIVDSVGLPFVSPPVYSGTVYFPQGLTGGVDSYTIMLTSVNAGTVYISDRHVSNGIFTGFSFVTDLEGQVMFMVSPAGYKSL